LDNVESSERLSQFLSYFFTEKVMRCLLQNVGWAILLAIFLDKKSGHPVWDEVSSVDML
jgi:hypothetical protein